MVLGRLRSGLQSPKQKLGQGEAAGAGAEAGLAHLGSQVNIAHWALRIYPLSSPYITHCYKYLHVSRALQCIATFIILQQILFIFAQLKAAQVILAVM